MDPEVSELPRVNELSRDHVNLSYLAGSHEILTHVRETTQKSVSLMANPRDLATMTMYRYTKYCSAIKSTL